MDKKFIPREKIEVLRDDAEKQLEFARKQIAFWGKKVDQLTGSLAMCNVILNRTKSEKALKKTKNG